MFNNRAIVGALGIWAFSSLPTAAALSWDVCTTDEAGVKTCRSRIPKSARIAIAVACLAVLLLLLSLVICVVRNRRAAAASQQEYNVEASQVDGPPTIIATEYNPTSGPSRVYSGSSKSGHLSANISGRMIPSPSPQMSGPALPIAAHQYNQQYYGSSQNHTAPVSQAAFPDQPYHFSGYSPRMGPSAPKTAFVTGGFPRPLLAGNRLKDRLKERPASVSSTLPGGLVPPSR